MVPRAEEKFEREARTLWKGNDVVLLVHVDDTIVGWRSREGSGQSGFLKRTLVVDASQTR